MSGEKEQDNRIGSIGCSVELRVALNLISVVPDERNLYLDLTGFQNLCIC